MDSTHVAVQVVDRISEKLSSLASALEVPSEHVYGVLAAQAYTVGCVNLFVFIVLACLSYVAVRLIVHGVREEEDGFIFAGVVMGVLSVGFSLVAFAQGILRVMNPEYYAIKEIFKVLN